MFFGAFSSSATKSRSSSVGMLARLSLCLVARTGVGDLGFGGIGSEKIHLMLVRRREHTHDDPGVRGETMKLLRRAEEKIQVAFSKLVQIFGLHLFERQIG